jgi:hypothetical protein
LRRRFVHVPNYLWQLSRRFTFCGA